MCTKFILTIEQVFQTRQQYAKILQPYSIRMKRGTFCVLFDVEELSQVIKCSVFYIGFPCRMVSQAAHLSGSLVLLLSVANIAVSLSTDAILDIDTR